MEDVASTHLLQHLVVFLDIYFTPSLICVPLNPLIEGDIERRRSMSDLDAFLMIHAYGVALTL